MRKIKTEMVCSFAKHIKAKQLDILKFKRLSNNKKKDRRADLLSSSEQ